jgi:hypothetical protein
MAHTHRTMGSTMNLSHERGPVAAGVNLLPLQSLDEALTTGIVIGIGRTAHTGNHLVLIEQRDVLFRSILHTTIPVMNQARAGCRSAMAL